MPIVSINTSAALRIDQAFTEVLNVTRNTLVDRRPDDRLTSFVVIGYGLAHPQLFKQAVMAAVDAFTDRPEGRTEGGNIILTVQEKETKIEELTKADDQSSACRYSRECTICYTASPSSRAVLTACGHTLCMVCVLKMELRGRLDCPFCRKESGYVKLHEEKEEEEEEEEEKETDKAASSVASLSLSTSEEAADSSTVTRPTVSSATVPPPPTVSRPTTFSINAPEFRPATVRPPTVPRPTVRPPTVPHTRAAYSIHVANVPRTTTMHQLIDMFAVVGWIVQYFVHHSGDAREFTFRFAYHCHGAAQRAVEMFNGRDGLLVRLAH